MSYHGKRESGDSRRHSSRRRESPSHYHRSRRSPSPGPSRSRGSPKPRDPKNLPESFGRVLDSGRTDDDLNILQRMKTAYENSPLADLYSYIVKRRKVKIWTRNYKEVRGMLTGYIVAFDKHWNLIVEDIDEVFLVQSKCKTPFLRDIQPDEEFPDIPAKVPKKKKKETEAPATEKPESGDPATEKDASDPEKPSDEPEKPSEEKVKVEGKEGKPKRKRRKHKKKVVSGKRKLHCKLFIRGDNIVMICPLDAAPVDEEEEEEDDDADSSRQM